MAIKSELQPYFKFPTDLPLQEGNILGNVACNEAIMPEAIAKLALKRLENPGGVGIVIGSGAAFSLLPQLQLDGIIFTDLNPAVLGFVEFVGESIAKSDNPAHAQEMILTELPLHLHELSPEDPTLPTVPSLAVAISRKLAREAERFGDAHWSNPEAFPKVQEALTSTTLTFANRNAFTSAFSAEVRQVLGLTEQDLTYINFSNVHHWLSSENSLEQYKQLATERTTIQYSTHPTDLVTASLQIQIADTFAGYFDLATKEIRTQRRRLKS